jgi:hypothetical protein
LILEGKALFFLYKSMFFEVVPQIAEQQGGICLAVAGLIASQFFYTQGKIAFLFGIKEKKVPYCTVWFFYEVNTISEPAVGIGPTLNSLPMNRFTTKLCRQVIKPLKTNSVQQMEIIITISYLP